MKTAALPPLYRQLAAHYLQAIQQGTLALQDRFPSVRQLMRQHGISMSTALQVCRVLEEQGWLQARPRSGYFVCRPERRMLQGLSRTMPAAPEIEVAAADYVGIHQHVSWLLARASRQPARVDFKVAVGESGMYPGPALQRLMRQALHRQPEMLTRMARRYGHPEFKQAMARRAMERGMMLAPADITATHGCAEAVHLALRAVTRPGDVVAVESPTFYGLLQVFESLGLKVLEIPADSRTGISVQALQFAVQQYPGQIRAVLVMPVFHNPLGCSMPDEHKRQLLHLCEQQDMALIEDDIYGYMGQPGTLPTPIKALDRSGRVIYCTSLNKMLAPGMRLGWLAGGRWQSRIEMLKYMQSRFPEEVGQVTVARYMASAAFDRHVMRMQQTLRRRRQWMADAVDRHFPHGTRLHLPQGGLLLWVQLPLGLDADALFEQALQHGIQIAPGSMFSNARRFDHCFRLSCGQAPDAAQDDALRTLGQMARQMQEDQSRSCASGSVCSNS